MQGSAPSKGYEIAVSATRLTKRFDDRLVVSDLSFRVGRGQAFGLLGPNGAGKTTTVRLLTGLLTPDAGTVTLFDEQVHPGNVDALRSRIGVQTDTNLYESLSARENLRAWGALYGLRQPLLRRRIDAVLETMGLIQRVDSLVGEFSKGMRQKLAVGRAILHEPELLFLDEPTAGLDPEAAADLIGHLTEMMRYHRTSVIICTHQLHGLETLCDEIGILRSGTLVTAGPVADLLRRRWPANRHRVEVAGDLEAARAALASLPEATVELDGDRSLTLTTTQTETVPTAVAALVHAGIPVHAVVPIRPTIEQFYFDTLAEGAQS